MELVVSIGAGLPVTRFGITARVSTGGGDYLKTGIWDEALPPGARAAVDLSFDFATAGESYLAGSAVIESAWFE